MISFPAPTSVSGLVLLTGGMALIQNVLTWRSYHVVALAALHAATSRLLLSPVYGSIPSSFYAFEIATGSMAVGLVLPLVSRHRLLQSILPFWMLFSSPLLGSLSGWSGRLGPIDGPLITLLVTADIASLLAGYSINAEVVDQRQALLKTVIGTGLFAVNYFVFVDLVPNFSLLSLQPNAYTSTLAAFLIPPYIQYLPPVILSFRLPQRLHITLLALLALIIATDPSIGSLTNVNKRLATSNGRLVDRRWSNTGYISVYDDLNEDMRLLRADHSLLGGEWWATSERKQDGWSVNEPIYAIFSMLEAVRLVERPSASVANDDKTAKALVIGAGIGTAPSALIRHGINTTIVELDPAVHHFAQEYFALPTNHTAILRDAVDWVSTEVQAQRPQQYDFIIHDVFTGGAEPPSLFSHPFLTNLHALLKPGTGVIALNYAGLPASASTQATLRRISSVFGHSCRAFRDAPAAPSQAESQANDRLKVDFANIVVFCASSLSQSEKQGDEKLTFRKPVEADFLQSLSRKQYLLPRAELEIPLPPPGADGDGGDGGEASERKKTTKGVDALMQTARQHWRIMRSSVGRREMWENW